MRLGRSFYHYPARPDWYFLFLFQFLKYFPKPLGNTWSDCFADYRHDFGVPHAHHW